MKILLVDDELEFVSTLAERLALRGIDVEWVNKPKEALNKATQNSYDLALLDVKMPGQSGFELKKELQEHCPDMKFIFLTGHGSKEAYQTGSEHAGEEYYLLKPIKIDDLMGKISKVLSS
jgi:DNA-binding response OmpR family regulator